MKTLNLSDDDFLRIGALLTSQAEQLDLEFNSLEETIRIVELPHDDDDTPEDIATDHQMSIDAHARRDSLGDHLDEVRRLAKIFVGDL